MKEDVVLIHGLWMFGLCLGLLGRRLRQCGYTVHVFSYPTVSCTLEQNAERLQHYVGSINAPTVHLVGHSFGGILVRALFHYYPEQRPGRLVSLGTPHNGCYVAEALARTAIGRKLIGKSVVQLASGAVQQWPLPLREWGTVSGSFGIGTGRLIVNLPKPHDGVLTVSETQLATATDQIVLPVAHLGLMFSAKVADNVCRFLRSGHFSRS